MNRKLLATAVAGAIAPMAAQALDVSVSGQVNRAIRFADNGVNSDVQHVDGSASGSRWRITAEGEVMPGITAGARLEQGLTSNRGWELDIEAPDSAVGNNVEFRHSMLYFSGDFGKVTMGNAPAAGNGVMWTSHTGAWAGTEYSPDTNSGLGVMTSDGMAYQVCTPIEKPMAGDVTHGVDADGAATHAVAEMNCAAQSVFSFMPSINIGRVNTLRYDTPAIGPITVSGSVQKDGATGHDWSFGVGLAHDVGAAAVKAGIIYMEDVLGIAGGLGFANGTSVNAAWGSDDSAGQDYEDMYVNVSHTWGNMNVGLGYRSTENGADMEGRGIGLGAQYALGSGVSVYAGFNNYSFDAPGADLEDINSFHIGSLVTFN